MQIDGETMETVTDFIFLDSKITSDGDCGHEIHVVKKFNIVTATCMSAQTGRYGRVTPSHTVRGT